ncbi:DeoR/GlpR family DNA-binding transcription regulator [Actinomadura keratinilytica]|uniref:DeoR/GlpR family DNA-binding transcription regulator n=1 Tax=Actinomadura keratinilytica TaxID=547461 RepID=A0ABP7XZZ1_9ACTN
MTVRRGPRAQTAERRALLVREVRAGNGNIHELARRFGVSTSTVRRDLRELELSGEITRTYGGAVGGPHPHELPLREKEHGHRREKDAIAAVAADLVETGDVVLLDAGSTTARLARRLRDRTGITVIAAGLNAIALLAEAPGVELILLGGRVRHPGEGVVGPFAEEQLRWLGPDKVFLGADGVTARGLCCPSPEQARIKHLMLHAGRATYVLADHSKIGAEPFAYWAPLDRPHTVIVDAAVRPADLEPLPGDTLIAAEPDQPGAPRHPG